MTTIDFATEAQATLRVLGTALEEGRISLELGALQLSALHQRHSIPLSEAGAAIVLAQWCSARPATPPGHPLHVASPPSLDALQQLLTEVKLAAGYKGNSTRGLVEHVAALHGAVLGAPA